MAIPIRSLWESTFNSHLRGSPFAQNSFYEQVKNGPSEGGGNAFCDIIPYRTLRELAVSLEWPSSEAVRASEYDYPGDCAPGWSHELQGVTHDEEHWYFTQAERMWRFPVGWDLKRGDAEEHCPSVDVPSGYNHFGDLDYYNGLLYVAIEGEGRSPIIAIYSRDLQPLASTQLPQPNCAWCAINPCNGLLYTCEFNGEDVWKPQPQKPLSLNVFRPLLQGDHLKLDHLGNFALFDESGSTPLVVNRVQGGAFSSRGHLYLVSDVPGGGIFGFDMTTGRRRLSIRVNYVPIATVTILSFVEVKTFQKQELQGITIWDIPPGRAPGISGQVHLVMSDKEIGLGIKEDDLYFKHFHTGQAG